MMNRYKLTYRRPSVERYVLHISSETLDEGGVEREVMELWSNEGNEIVKQHGVRYEPMDGPAPYSDFTITNGWLDRDTLQEAELINVVEI